MTTNKTFSLDQTNFEDIHIYKTWDAQKVLTRNKVFKVAIIEIIYS